MLKKIRKMLQKQEGFTLVELMIVVVILGIISGIGIQQYGAVQKRAKQGVHEANHKVISGAVQMYALVENDLPLASNVDDATSNIEALVIKGYLEAIPENPFTNEQDYAISFETDDTAMSYTLTISPGVEQYK